MFYAKSGSDIAHSGGTTSFTTTTVSVTLPSLGVSYDLFVVAFSGSDYYML